MMAKLPHDPNDMAHQFDWISLNQRIDAIQSQIRIEQQRQHQQTVTETGSQLQQIASNNSSAYNQQVVLPAPFVYPLYQQHESGRDPRIMLNNSLAYNQPNFAIEPINPTLGFDATSTQRIQPRPHSTSINEGDLRVFRNEGVILSSDDITPVDVLCGRGAGSNNHAGNVSFRSLIDEYRETYYHATPVEKAEIAKGIIAVIKERGGRFIKRSSEKGPDGKSTHWFEVSEKMAREKTCQALREGMASDEHHASKGKEDSTRLNLVTTKQVLAGSLVVRENDVLLGR
jgi:hypothetical protein